MESGVSRNKSLELPVPDSNVQNDRPELSDATRYDLDRLERVVGDLVRKHSQLADHYAVLRATVSERDDKILQLESDLKRSVSDLNVAQSAFERDCSMLQSDVEKRDSRIGELEEELERAARRRRSAIERVDRLIVELDRLDAEFDEKLTA